MKFRPLHDRVVLRRIDEDERTRGGIIIPDTAKEKPQQGKIISTGKGKVLDDGSIKKLQVKKGDLVLFTSYAGTDVKIDDQQYLIMNESDILAVIE